MDDIVLDRSGQLKTGYFFWLDPVGEDLFDGEEKQSGWFWSARNPSEEQLQAKSGRSYLTGHIEEFPEAEHRCKVSPLHRTKSIWRKPVIELRGGPEFSELIPLPNSGNAVVLTEALCDRLKQQKFEGLNVVEAIVQGETKPPRGQNLFVLNFLGDRCLRPMQIVTTASNSCYSCGTSPVLCPECGEIAWRCPKCEKHPAVPKNSVLANVPGILRVQIRAGREPAILGGHQWDGSDFISGGCMVAGRGIVTRRVINWLLSQHVAPFVAEPLAVDVSKMSVEQLKHLETVK